MTEDSHWLKSPALRSTLLVMAGLFVVSFGLFGVRDTVFLDDHVHLCPEPAAAPNPMAGRCALDRHAAEPLYRLVFPLLAGQFWIAHLLVVAAHALNIVLVFRFVRLAAGATPPAFLAAALFGFWPLQCEVVFWASQLHRAAAMSLLLCAGTAWLRAAPERDGWAGRAWPVLPLLVLAGLLDIQAGAAAVALAALTAFVHSPSARTLAGPVTESDSVVLAGGCGEIGDSSAAGGADATRNDAFKPAACRYAAGTDWSDAGAALRRFAVQFLFLALPALFLGLLSFNRTDGAPAPPTSALPATAPTTAPADKFGLELRTQLRFLPGMRYSRLEVAGAFSRLPELAEDHPFLRLLLPAVAAAAVWAAARSPVSAAGPVVPTRLAGTILFGIVVWFAAIVPLALSRDHCPALRTGYASGLAQAVVAAVVLWGIWGLTTGPVSRIAARVVFALMLLLGTFCNLVEGWQYAKQFEIDRSQAAQASAQWSGRPGRKVLLVANVQPYSQVLTVGQWDHISTVWAYPWVARAFLRREFAGEHIDYMTSGFAGPSGVRPQALLDGWESVYAFSFVGLRGAVPGGENRSYHLIPARGLEFRREDGKVIRRLRLPSMADVRDGSGESPIFAAVYVPDWMSLTWPPALSVYEEK